MSTSVVGSGTIIMITAVSTIIAMTRSPRRDSIPAKRETVSNMVGLPAAVEEIAESPAGLDLMAGLPERAAVQQVQRRIVLVQRPQPRDDGKRSLGRAIGRGRYKREYAAQPCSPAPAEMR